MQVPTRGRMCAVPALLGMLLLSVAGSAQVPGLPPAAPPEAAAPEVSLEEQRGRELAGTLDSPRAAMRHFLEAMGSLWEDPTAWARALESLDLGEADEVVGQRRARELYGVLNRIERVDVDRIPDLGEVGELGLESFRFFPDRRRQADVLRKLRGAPAGPIVIAPDRFGAWRFSEETVRRLPDLFLQMEALPLLAGSEILTVSDWIEAQLPAWLVEAELLTVQYWQWLAILVVIVLGLVLDLLVRLAVRATSKRLARRLGAIEDPEQVRRTLRPIGWFAAAVFWLVTLRFLGLQGLPFQVLNGTLGLFVAITGTNAGWRITGLLSSLFTYAAEHTATRTDDVLVPLVDRAIRIFIGVAGLLFAAHSLQIPLTPFLASLTLVGVALSFAAKDTVENFFGSVAVLFDRPFEIGDWVVVDGTEGIVELVGFRSTRIRTFYNSQITVPNANLVRAVVDNYGRRRFRRWKTTLGVAYQTPPDRLVAFTEGIRELIRNHPYTRKDYYQVWCNDFAASSLDILLYMFFEVPDWSTELRERERLFLDIVRLANRLGVSFAYPTQTVHVHTGDAPRHAYESPGQDSEEQAGWEGIRAAQSLIRQQPWRGRTPPPVQFQTGPTDLPLDDAGNPIEEPPAPTDERGS